MTKYPPHQNLRSSENVNYYSNIQIRSTLWFSVRFTLLVILAKAAMTMGTTFLASLETLAIFLQTTTFNAVAACLRTLQICWSTFSGFSVPTTDTSALLTTSLTGSVALTVFCLAEAFDTPTTKLPSGGKFIKKIVKFVVLFMMWCILM